MAFNRNTQKGSWGATPVEEETDVWIESKAFEGEADVGIALAQEGS